MAYDATTALALLLKAQHANPNGQRTGHDATTAFSQILPQAAMPSDGRAAFTLSGGVAVGSHPAPVVSAAVSAVKTESPKKSR